MFRWSFIVLVISLLVACGSGERYEPPSDAGMGEKFTPNSLVNTKITLSHTQVTAAGTRVTQASVDKTILRFDANRFSVIAEDGLTLPSVYGYRLSQDPKHIWITSTNGVDGYEFELLFTSKTSGTFEETYTGFDGVVAFYREGSFNLEQEDFSFLPQTIVNTNFHLNFESVVSNALEEESPVVGERLEMRFFKNSQAVLEQSNLLPLQTEADYSFNRIDASSLAIQGQYKNTGHSYKVTARFDGLTSGTFSLDINNGEATASGKFDTIKFTPIDKFELQGEFLGRSLIKSTNTSIEYPYNVYLPPDYSDSEKHYPVIYVTDGQWYSDFAYLLEKKSKEFIMVSIEQGPRDRRMIDYLPEGHDAYTKFLKEELIPLIESTYRTNGERSFTGVSAGGLLGAHLLSIEPIGEPYFKNYLLIDGAMWAITNSMLSKEASRFQQSKSLAVNILLAGTPQGNGWSVNLFEMRYRDRHYDNLFISNQEFRVTHDEMGPLAFDSLIDNLQ